MTGTKAIDSPYKSGFLLITGKSAERNKLALKTTAPGKHR